MSLVVNISVGHRDIGFIVISRVTPLIDEVHDYVWSAHLDAFPPVRSGPVDLSGIVKHKYTDGAPALMHKVLGEMIKESP